MFENILVPLDGSTLSESILPQAEELSRKLGAPLVLLHVTPDIAEAMRETSITGGPLTAGNPEVTADLMQKSVDAQAATGAEYLQNLEARLKQQGFAVKTVQLQGSPASAIISYCNENGVSMIAMSTHGRSGISRTVFGSVADEIMRSTHLPVLMLRPEEADG